MSGSGDESGAECLDAELEAYRCPICLQPVEEQSYTDPCFHQFCFCCLLQWLEHSPRCPLCNGAVAAVVRQEESGRIVRTQIAPQPAARRRPTASYARYGRDGRLDDAHESLGMRKREAVYLHGLRRAPAAAAEGSGTRVRVSQAPQRLRVEVGQPRSRAWIRRDLQAALGIEDVAIIEALVVRLVAVAGTLPMSAPAVRALERLLGDKTALFLDELAAFLDSSLDMRSYDLFIAYDTRQQD